MALYDLQGSVPYTRRMEYDKRHELLCKSAALRPADPADESLMSARFQRLPNTRCLGGKQTDCKFATIAAGEFAELLAISAVRFISPLGSFS